jgi:hypothetical protein
VEKQPTGIGPGPLMWTDERARGAIKPEDESAAAAGAVGAAFGVAGCGISETSGAWELSAVA